MSAIRVCSIEFSKIPFRRLRLLSIPIAERITLIAGHNGTGKSTILAFIANDSGLSEKEYVSYFNRAVQANFQEIIHLTEDHDFIDDADKKPYVMISYDIDGKILVKKGNVTRRGKELFRVVPRNDPKQDFEHEGIAFKSDAKVPLPTIYLGMTRVIPIGESNRLHVRKSSDTTMPAIDRNYIQKVTNELIETGRETADLITHQSITHTKKVSKHADYAYDSRAISLGQDSLSSIVTALASFKKLQREMGESYPGGLLIVDEVDAGFHPRTQTKLLRILQREATTLGLQIIATTHSLVLIESVSLQIQKAPTGKSQDKLHYLQDTRNPHLCEGWSFEQIKADMYLEPPTSARTKKPVVLVYAEDDEAHLYAERLLCGPRLSKIAKETKVRLKVLSIKMGHDDLLKLYKADHYFKTVVIVVDADVEEKKIRGMSNVVRLPGTAAIGDRPTPELLLYRFIQTLIDDRDSHLDSWKKLDKLGLSSDYLAEHLLNDHAVQLDKRDSAKVWFTQRVKLMKVWGLIDLWVDENAALAEDFVDSMINAIRSVHPEQ
ncbi:MAG: AAA ATPase [Rhodocyclaceae bacterium]|nr:MAG: AAA ATPase [Rhodocyclaceae bacterium]TND02526.1 MAG: AAA ATPase [Rhodocyclaceae bacterium]